MHRIADFSRNAMILLANHLAATYHYPGDVFVHTVCRDFVKRYHLFNHTPIAIRYLVALAKLGCRDEEAIHFARNIVMNAPLTLKHVLLVGWSLSILDAFNEEATKWWIQRVGQANYLNTTLIEKRYFYQTLLHIYVFRPDLGRLLDVDPEFEEVCLESWRQRVKEKAYTSHGVLQIMTTLRELGFYCFRSHFTFGRRLNISIFFHRRYTIQIGIFAEEGFANNRQRLKGPQIWKRQLLEKMNWTLLKVPILEWENLNSRVEKREYLRKKIVEIMSKRIAMAKGIRPEAN